MKRRRRWLFDLMASLSLLVSVATMAMWVDSYRPLAAGWQYPHSFNFSRSEPRCWIISLRGQTVLYWQDGNNLDKPSVGSEYLGIQWGRFFPGKGGFFRFISVHYWMIFLTTLPVPLIRLHIWRRDRKRLRESFSGKCSTCGYDLRATPARCPECGTSPPKKDVISN
jgi:hypothetical protein